MSESGRKLTLKKAVLINICSRYAHIILNIIISAILARIISPENFGVIAVISVFTTFFSSLSDMGLSTAIIQNRDLSKRDVECIYSFSVYISIGVALLFFVLSNAIADIYSNQIYVKIGRLLSISLLFSSANMVPNGILNREKKFVNIAIRNIVVYVTVSMITIFAAFRGAGVYALVMQSILTSFFTFLWSIVLTKQKFCLKFEYSSIKKIASYSGYQYAFGMLNYFARNLDSLLAGKFIGAIDLAFYNRAYSLMLYPVNNITGVITPVLHPILADYQDDKAFLYKQNLKLIKCLAIISIFVEVYCIFAAPDIIMFMYGVNWERSIICFRILSIAIATQMITGTTGSVFQALGETKLLFRVGVINSFITVLATVVAIIGKGTIENLSVFVASSYILHFFISFYVMMHYGFRCSFLRFLLELWKEVVIFLVLIIAGVLFPKIDGTALVNLLLKGIYFGLVYVFCLFVTKEYRYIKLLWKKKRD